MIAGGATRRIWPLALFGLAILAGCALARGIGDATPFERMRLIALQLPALLLGIGLHEWAHAVTAYRLGDLTPKADGRLSLNPLDHLDPMGTLMILVAYWTGWPIIGWGKPVMINPSAFRNPVRDGMLVALAGPLMNLALLACSLLLFHALPWESLDRLLGEDPTSSLGVLVGSLIATNAGLALFNMIPLPPLDGSRVLAYFLPADGVRLLGQMQPFGIVIVWVLLANGALGLPFLLLMKGVRHLQDSAPWAVGFAVIVALTWKAIVAAFPRYD